MFDNIYLRIGLTAVLALLAATTAASFVLTMALGGDLDAVRPWTYPEFLWRFGWHYELHKGLVIASVVGMMFGVGVIVLSLFRRARSDFGRARWANWTDLRKAGFMKKQGIILGHKYGEDLKNNEDIHVLVGAPTGAGKGVGLVIPNLLAWGDTVVVFDMKHENYIHTSGWRAEHGHRVFLWSPMSEDRLSCRYNPLDAIRPEPENRISDLQQLANILLPPPKHGDDSMWQLEARDLFIGLCLYVMDNPDLAATIGQVYRVMATDGELGAVCHYILENEADNLDPACIASLANFAHKAPKERSGVKSNLSAALSLWKNPVVDAATSASDFDLRNLRKNCYAIYVGVTPNQIAACARLLNLFFQQCINVLSRKLPEKDEPRKVLLLIDEFPALGRMEALTKALAYLRGYNVRVMTIIQGLSQLDELYGPAGRESILQNSGMQVFFAMNDEATAGYVSRRLGKTTINTTSKSSRSAMEFGSRSRSSAARDFMLPEEVRLLEGNKQIIFKDGCPPILANKHFYYKTRRFKKCLRSTPPVKELKIIQHEPVVFDLPVKAQEVSSKTVAGNLDVAGSEDVSGFLDNSEVLDN